MSGVAGDQAHLDKLEQHIGPDVASGAIADVLSRLGQKDAEFRPDVFGRSYGGPAVSDAAKDMIARLNPSAAQTLGNAAEAHVQLVA